MSSISEEIKELQSKILELEKQKKENDESDKKTSLDHNFNVISDLLFEKKNAVRNHSRLRQVYKTLPLIAIHYEKELVMHLEAIYNILHILDDRIKKLEKN